MRLSGRKASSSAPRWRARPRAVLFSLIAVNCAVFAAQLVVQLNQPALLPEYFGLSYRGINQAYAWQFGTALFLHSGVFQFAGNMLVLYVIGRDIDSILGQKHFLYLYLCGALGGELSHLFLMPSTTVLFAGSGGVAAIVVALATILPELEPVQSLSVFSPGKVKAKYLGHALCALALILLVLDRHGVVSHSAWLGGAAAGWLYVHLLGFGRPSWFELVRQRRRAARERRHQMSFGEFVEEEIDPLLEKISQTGLASLTRSERRTLAQVRTKMNEPSQ